jgi:hypothetical protein
MKKWIVVLIIACLVVPTIVFAETLAPTKEPTKEPSIKPTPTLIQTPDENTIYKVIYEGERPIADTLAAKAAEKSKTELDPYEKLIILSSATDTTMKAEKYPLDISKDAKTIIRIEKFLCTQEICGYWIQATRDGQEVATNSPVWISPPPYIALISESFDASKNEMTITLKEDPKLAVEQILQRYVDNQPLGKAIVGTKE